MHPGACHIVSILQHKEDAWSEIGIANFIKVFEQKKDSCAKFMLYEVLAGSNPSQHIKLPHHELTILFAKMQLGLPIKAIAKGAGKE